MLQELEIYLGALQRQDFFNVWHEREIMPGKERVREIDIHLSTAQIILLLISQHFMNSDYCYLDQMKRAMERHEFGEACVIPVILRPVYWKRAPSAKLQSLPTNAEPVTSSKWHSLDEAFFDVAEGIRKAVEKFNVSPSFRIEYSTSQVISDEAFLHRTAILTKLRKLYILSHDNISPGIIAGTEPLPKEWVEEQLVKMGETWRQEI